MFKIYQKYLIYNFFSKYLVITLIFLLLVFILNILEEITFLKNLNQSPILPYFLTLLNTPITLFEISPFIFFLSTQFLFYDLFKKNELNFMKVYGLSNLKILKIIFLFSVIVGVFNVLIFYNVASKLKFLYSDLKNELSNDNKYLAMVTDSGLWIKDEKNEKILIIKSKYIEKNFLYDTIINEFDNEFQLKRSIQSNKIDIKKNEWKIYNPILTVDNISSQIDKEIFINTNFNENKIKNLFSNISTLAIFELLNLKKDFDNLGYSSDEIVIHLFDLITLPLFCGILSIISAIIMFELNVNRSPVFYAILGILISVIIYYLKFLFISLGLNDKIPLLLSVMFPLVFLSLTSLFFLISINEK